MSGFTIIEDPGKYLGVLILHQRITKHVYSYLNENMHKKLAS
jgi:hypothetical protein